MRVPVDPVQFLGHGSGVNAAESLFVQLIEQVFHYSPVRIRKIRRKLFQYDFPDTVGLRRGDVRRDLRVCILRQAMAIGDGLRGNAG